MPRRPAASCSAAARRLPVARAHLLRLQRRRHTLLELLFVLRDAERREAGSGTFRRRAGGAEVMPATDCCCRGRGTTYGWVVPCMQAAFNKHPPSLSPPLPASAAAADAPRCGSATACGRHGCARGCGCAAGGGPQSAAAPQSAQRGRRILEGRRNHHTWHRVGGRTWEGVACAHKAARRATWQPAKCRYFQQTFLRAHALRTALTAWACQPNTCHVRTCRARQSLAANRTHGDPCRSGPCRRKRGGGGSGGGSGGHCWRRSRVVAGCSTAAQTAELQWAA